MPRNHSKTTKKKNRSDPGKITKRGGNNLHGKCPLQSRTGRGGWTKMKQGGKNRVYNQLQTQFRNWGAQKSTSRVGLHRSKDEPTSEVEGGDASKKSRKQNLQFMNRDNEELGPYKPTKESEHRYGRCHGNRSKRHSNT